MADKLEERLETLRLALLLVGKHADEAMHVGRVSRDVLEEIEQHEATLKAMIAELSAPEAADEITRLNALVDEMRKGLEEINMAARTVKSSGMSAAWVAGKTEALITKAQPPVSHDQ